MSHLNIKKRKKYVVTGAAAMAVAVASCGLGVYNSQDVNLQNSSIYMAGNTACETNVDPVVSGATVTDAVSDDDLIRQMSDSVSMEEKDVYKDETVYVFADASGDTDSILVNEKLKNREGSAELVDKTDLTDIVNVKGDETFSQSGDVITWQADGQDICYQGTTDKELPVEVSISYYLNGEKMTPEEIAGKSGQVKIRFDYTNNSLTSKKIDGKNEEIKTPFVTVSGVILGDNFTDISVENGKLMSEGDSNIVVGYAMPGMLDSLGIDAEDLSDGVSFPEYFEISADVTDFSLDMTVTLVMNGSEMNMAGVVDMSELDNMVDSLTDASAQLVEGSGQLSEGVDTLLSKMGDFNSGVSQLKQGLDSLAEGSGTLASGVNTINVSAQSINQGVAALDAALSTPMSDEVKQQTAKEASDAAQAAVKSTFEGGQYDAIAQQASKSFSTTINSKDTINMIYSGLKANAGLRDGLYNAGVLSAYQTTAAQNPGLTYEMFIGMLDEQTKANIYAQVDNSLLTMATQIAAGIAENGADAMGAQVAGACEEAAVTAAGQAAGQAAVAGAEGAKSQISAQINAQQDNGYSLVTGTKALADGISTLAAKVPELTNGVNQLVGGVGKLASGSSQLSDGVSQLSEGASKLDDGMNQFNRDAIQKLANAYNGDVKSLVSRVNAVLEAATEYDTFTMLNEGDTGATKFIIKTEGISAE